LFYSQPRAVPPEAPRAYSGNAPCLFRKRPVLISEAPGVLVPAEGDNPCKAVTLSSVTGKK